MWQLAFLKKTLFTEIIFKSEALVRNVPELVRGPFHNDSELY